MPAPRRPLAPRTSRLISVCVAVASVVGCEAEREPEQIASDTTDEAADQQIERALEIQPPPQEFGGSRHREMTRLASASWVLESMLPTMEDASLIGDTDPETWILSEAHFDNCYWDEGRDYVLENRADAVAAAVEFASTGSDADRQAFFDQWGYAIHAIEDHYSHSNWVETHEAGELAPLDVPGEPKPQGWFSGTYDNPGDSGPNAGAAHCPFGTPHHNIFSKDGSGLGVNAEAYFTATIALQDQFDKMVADLHVALGDDTDAVLVGLGFQSPLPARARERADAGSIFSFGSTTVGYLTPRIYCPAGTWVDGFAQRVEAEISGDNTALNSVVLNCSAPDVETRRLAAWEGVWGDWSDVDVCPQDAWITTASLKWDPSDGLIEETEANAVRFGCSDGTSLAAANDGPWGDWAADESCAPGEAVCGVQVRVQPPLGGGFDDTAMTGLVLHCCALEQDPDETGETGETGDPTDGEDETGDTTDGDTDDTTGDADTGDTGDTTGDGDSGDTGDSGDSESDTGTDSLGLGEGDDGCSCRSNQGPAGPGKLAWMGLLIALARLGRRARRA